MRVLRRCDDGPQVVWHKKFRLHRRVGPDTPVRSKKGNSQRTATAAPAPQIPQWVVDLGFAFHHGAV